MLLTQVTFSPIFHFLYQKLTSSGLLPDEHLLGQARRFIDDSATLSDQFISKKLYNEAEEFLLTAIKLQRTPALSSSPSRLFPLFHRLALLYKSLKRPNKAYEVLSSFLHAKNIEQASAKLQKEFSLSGIEKIYLIFSEFCLGLVKYGEAGWSALKAISFIRLLIEDLQLLREFRLIIGDSKRFEEKIVKKKQAMAHGFALLSKARRKEGDYEQAFENLEQSLKILQENSGENIEVINKFTRKLNDLGRKRDLLRRMSSFEENQEEMPPVMRLEPQNTLFFQTNKPKNRKTMGKALYSPPKTSKDPPEFQKPTRINTVPHIKIVVDQQQDPKQEIPPQENSYFLSKGFKNVTKIGQNKQKRSRKTTNSTLNPKNPLTKSTANSLSINYLTPSQPISSSRALKETKDSKETETEVQMKSSKKAEFISKLPGIDTGQKQRVNTEMENNSFLTDRMNVGKMKQMLYFLKRPNNGNKTPPNLVISSFQADQQNVGRMKHDYYMSKRPATGTNSSVFKGRPSMATERPSVQDTVNERFSAAMEKNSKVTGGERSSYKNKTLIVDNPNAITKIQLSVNNKGLLFPETQNKSPMMTPTHRVTASPLIDSFSKRVNPRKVEPPGIMLASQSKKPRDLKKKSHSYRASKKPQSSLEKRTKNVLKRQSVRSILDKSPSLEHLGPQTPDRKGSKECLSEKSPFLTVNPSKKSHKFTWESKDFGSFSDLSRNRELEKFEIQTNTDIGPKKRTKTKPHVVIRLREMIAGIKILKAFRKLVNYRKYNMIFGRQIPLLRFPDLPTPYKLPPAPRNISKPFEASLTLSPDAFNTIAGIMRQSFPRRGFRLRFPIRGGIASLTDWRLEETPQSLVKMKLVLGFEGHIFHLETSSSTLYTRNELFYHQYIWPLAARMLDMYLSEMGLSPPEPDLSQKGLILKPGQEEMDESEEKALLGLVEKLKWLLQEKIIRKLKPNGWELKISHEYKRKIGVLDRFLGERSRIIRESLCKRVVISPDWLEHLGLGKRVEVGTGKARRGTKKAWSFSEFKSSHYIASLFFKRSFENAASHGLSSISSSISPRSQARRPPPHDFTLSKPKPVPKSPSYDLKHQETQRSPPLSKLEITEEIILEDSPNLNSGLISAEIKRKISPKLMHDISKRSSEPELSINKPKLDNFTKKNSDSYIFSSKKSIENPGTLGSKMSLEIPDNHKFFSVKSIENQENRIRASHKSLATPKNPSKQNKKPEARNKNIYSSSILPLSSHILEFSSHSSSSSKNEQPILVPDAHFPAYIFRAASQNLPSEGGMIPIELEMTPFFDGQLIYRQLIKKLGVYMLLLLRVELLEIGGLGFVAEMLLMPGWRRESSPERLRFKMKEFKEQFLPLLDNRKFCYRKGFSRFEKHRISKISQKCFDFVNAKLRILSNKMPEAPANIPIQASRILPEDKETVVSMSATGSWAIGDDVKTMKLHNNTLFLRIGRHYLRLPGGKYYRFQTYGDYSTMKISLYEPFLKKCHYSIVKSKDFIEKLVILLQMRENSKLVSLLLRPIMAFQKTLVGQKLLLTRESPSRGFFLQRIPNEACFYYVRLTIHIKTHEILIELLPTSSKTKIRKLRLNYHDLEGLNINIKAAMRNVFTASVVKSITSAPKLDTLPRSVHIPETFSKIMSSSQNVFRFDVPSLNAPNMSQPNNTHCNINEISKIDGNCTPVEFSKLDPILLQKLLMPLIILRRGPLYKTPLIRQSQSRGSLGLGQRKEKKKGLLKPVWGTWSVLLQQVRRLAGDFVIISVIKQERLDFWNLIVEFPRVSRRFITNLYKSDILKMREESLKGLFAEDLEDLERKTKFLFNKRRKSALYHEFHEAFTEKSIRDVFKPRRSLPIRSSDENERKVGFERRRMSFIMEVEKKEGSKQRGKPKGENKEFLGFCELKFWEELIVKASILVNKQNKLILKIDTFHGILREIIAVGNIASSKSLSPTHYFEIFLERTHPRDLKSNISPPPPLKTLSLSNPRSFSVFLRITDLMRKDCRNFKFPLESLAQYCLPANFKAKDLKIIKQKLKKQLKGDFSGIELPRMQNTGYKLNDYFHDFKLENKPILLIFKGVFTFRPRKILGIFVNIERRRLYFYLFDNLEARELVNVIKLKDLAKLMPFVKEIVREGMWKELGKRVFVMFKNRLVMKQFCKGIKQGE